MRQANKEAKDNSNAFKHLFDAGLMQRIATAVQRHDPAFDVAAFVGISAALVPLEMKARVQLIRTTLKALLPASYPDAIAILLKALADRELSGFTVWPIADFVETYGQDAPGVSLEALREITVHFTSEWAVRPFIEQDMAGTMAFLLACAHDNNEHVRRWASEGSRPRLPWGRRLACLIDDPSPVLPILEALRHDDALYVRKSVANHINDITKDHPEVAIALLQRWQAEAAPADLPRIDWIIARALRNMIKAGHPEALALIGVGQADVLVDAVRITRKAIVLGQALEFSVTLQSTSSAPQKLVVDYVMHFMKKNGATAPKVFKLKTLVLAAGETVTITRRHPLKRITTRDYYPGRQGLQIQVNGVAGTDHAWELSLA